MRRIILILPLLLSLCFSSPARVINNVEINLEPNIDQQIAILISHYRFFKLILKANRTLVNASIECFQRYKKNKNLFFDSQDPIVSVKNPLKQASGNDITVHYSCFKLLRKYFTPDHKIQSFGFPLKKNNLPLSYEKIRFHLINSPPLNKLVSHFNLSLFKESNSLRYFYNLTPKHQYVLSSQIVDMAKISELSRFDVQDVPPLGAREGEEEKYKKERSRFFTKHCLELINNDKFLRELDDSGAFTRERLSTLLNAENKKFICENYYIKGQLSNDVTKEDMHLRGIFFNKRLEKKLLAKRREEILASQKEYLRLLQRTPTVLLMRNSQLKVDEWIKIQSKKRLYLEQDPASFKIRPHVEKILKAQNPSSAISQLHSHAKLNLRDSLIYILTTGFHDYQIAQKSIHFYATEKFHQLFDLIDYRSAFLSLNQRLKQLLEFKKHEAVFVNILFVAGTLACLAMTRSNPVGNALNLLRSTACLFTPLALVSFQIYNQLDDTLKEILGKEEHQFQHKLLDSYKNVEDSARFFALLITVPWMAQSKSFLKSLFNLKPTH